MTPREVAAVLREISQLLQLKGENAFKVRAYDMGADAFETLPPDPAAPGGLYARVKGGTLAELEGVGKAIDQALVEFLERRGLAAGSVQHHDDDREGTEEVEDHERGVHHHVRSRPGPAIDERRHHAV